MKMNPQNSQAWEEDRLGEFTGSRIDVLIPSPKEVKAEGTKKADKLKFLNRVNREAVIDLVLRTGVDSEDKLTLEHIDPLYNSTPGKIVWPDTFIDGALTYIWERAAQIVNPWIAPEVESAAVLWGNQYEAEMFEAVEDAWGIKLETPPYMTSPCGNFGSSPDRVSHEHGIVLEGKCPYIPANFLRQSMYDVATLKAKASVYYGQCQAHIAVTGYKCYWVNYDPRVKNPKKRLSILEVPRDDQYQSALTKYSAMAVAERDRIVKEFLERDFALNI